ncbi:MAG: hypothetical protein H6581_27230 [Bacteroidia bacterium]|nr:hypothetical protein [Bacteroidia bacterium]
MKSGKSFLLLLLFWTLGLGVLQAHPYHVSVFQLEYNPENKTLELTVKVFLDDMHTALKNWAAAGLDFESSSSNPFLKNYLIKTTRIKAGGEWLPMDFVGKETDEEAIWIYMEIPVGEKPLALDFETSLLTEIFDDQMNIVHLKLSEEEKTSARLGKSEQLKEFRF